jgi:predicted O-methyltransferase YrrM
MRLMPKLIHPSAVVRNSFYGFADMDKAWNGMVDVAESLAFPGGVFAADNLIALGRNLGFLDDAKFVSAYQRWTTTPQERAAIWRMATLLWGARQALRVEGDFVECGCYKGVSARILADVLDFAALDRRYFLYDLFEHDESMPHHSMVEHGETLVDQVRARFADVPNAIITKGWVPQSLSEASPDKIAFMHLDLNNAEAEVGALEVLFERISPGGVLILDDFGWLAYRSQHTAEIRWMGERGYSILELPTGQGMVIK